MKMKKKFIVLSVAISTSLGVSASDLSKNVKTEDMNGLKLETIKDLNIEDLNIEDFISKRLNDLDSYINPEKQENKYYNHVFKNNVLYVKSAIESPIDIFTKIKFKKNDNLKYSYKGNFYTDPIENKNLDIFLDELNYLPFEGDIELKDGKYVYNFLSKNKNIKISSREKINDYISIDSYILDIKIDETLEREDVNINFKNIENFKEGHFEDELLRISNFDLFTDNFKLSSKIDSFAYEVYDKNKNIEKSLPMREFSFNDLSLSSELLEKDDLNSYNIYLDIKDLKFNNPLLNNVKTKLEKIKFNLDFDFTKNTSIEDVSKLSLYNDEKKIQVLNSIIEEPVSLNIGFYFTENNFENSVKVDFSSDHINVKSLKDLSVSNYENITKNLHFNFEATLSEKYSMFLSFSPKIIRDNTTLDDSGVAKIKIDQEILKKYLLK